MFLVPGGYGSAGLSHVFLIACFTFYFIYSAWIFVLCFFSASCWYIVFVALNAMRISVLLNKLVTLLIIGLTDITIYGLYPNIS